MVAWIAVFFICAGTAHWVRGWICAVTCSGTMLALGGIVHRRNSELFAARASWRHNDTRRFDKFILQAFLPLPLLLPALAGLDTVRFHWSAMPFRTVFRALAVFLSGMRLVGWALCVNPWAESTVRIQRDRKQQVVRRGPYRWVRHPMCLGGLTLYPAAAVVLGSMAALAIGGLIEVLVVLRTALVDRTLQGELAGYRDYAAVTRWRLLPGVW
ncbi:MAG TPA: methyltransferase [Acidobacteriaceae bacterium]|nr:methyltransferase [Acidobacteriaceae bacterium]